MEKLKWRIMPIDESNWKDEDDYYAEMLARNFNESEVKQAVKLIEPDRGEPDPGDSFYAEFLVLAPNFQNN